MNDSREQLAALAHEQWAAWMKYLFEKSIDGGDGSVEIPALYVARWKRQMNTSYLNLSEKEKESDRAEADKVLRVIQFNSEPNLLSQPKEPISRSDKVK
jgi:hypothetical protein